MTSENLLDFVSAVCHETRKNKTGRAERFTVTIPVEVARKTHLQKGDKLLISFKKATLEDIQKHGEGHIHRKIERLKKSVDELMASPNDYEFLKRILEEKRSEILNKNER